MNSVDRLPILRARSSDVAEYALVVGEPKRAEFAANFLDNAREVGSYREYLTYTGEYKGKRITIASHGVGAAGASIAFHELFQAGVKTVIRGGSAGGFEPGLIIATGAIRMDGTSEQLVPMAYPAVAHYQIVQALQSAAAKNNYPSPKVGILLTRSYLYTGLIDHPWKIWFDAGVLGVEMELAVLLVMAGIRGIRAGGIFASDGTLADENVAKDTDKSGYDPFNEELIKNTHLMVRVALDALASID